MKKKTIAVSFLALLLAVVCCRKEDGAPGLDFLSGARSFSFIIFEGKAGNDIKQMLKEHAYAVVSRKEVRGDYVTIMGLLEDSNNKDTIVPKGIVERDDYTVLFDPERVVIIIEDSLLKMAKAKNINIHAAIWESELKLLAFVVFSPEGIATKNVFIGDDADAGNSNADAILAKSKDGGGLIKALMNRGLPLADIFSNDMKAEILTLKE